MVRTETPTIPRRPSWRAAFLAAAAWLLASCLAGRAATPSATTAAATAVATGTATLNGSVAPNGLASSACFQWGPTAAYGSQTPVTLVPAGTATAALTATLPRLTAQTTYHFRLATTNSDGAAWGADQTFTTSAPTPSATTLPAGSVTTVSASLGARIIPYGALVGFQWGPTTAYGNLTAPVVVAGGSTTLNDSITGLTPATQYHYRVTAANSGGVAYGADQSFTTGAAAPQAVTTGATMVTETAATLNGEINPEGLATSVSFQWGLTAAYGNSTPALTLGNGSQSSLTSQRLTGLTPGSLYHFRVTAANGAGPATGQDLTFTTAPLLPGAVTLPATAVTGGSATLNGLLNPNGYPATAAFQWGTSTAYGQSTTPAPFGTTPGTANDYANVAATLTGLLPVTTYHFRLRGANASGSSPGADQTFTTIGPSPSTTTLPPTQITGISALAGGTANPEGLPASAFFLWGATRAYGSSTPPSPAGNGTSPVSESALLTGLIPTSTYHYAMAATNGGGMALGADQALTTVAHKPVVATLPATGIAQFSATLQGTVNAEGLPTTYYFQYGTNTSYGSQTPTSPVGSGTSAVPYSQFVSLNPYTTYHYRIAASNAGGTSFGNDVTFTTLAPSPSVTTGPASAVTPAAAVLNGTVQPFGLAATWWFSWGTTTSYGNRTVGGSVNGLAAVNAPLAGLTPGTTYHFNLSSISIGGTGTGNDQTFTTPLTMIVPHGVRQAGGKIHFWWDSTPGMVYRVESATPEPAPAWHEAATVRADGTTTSYSEPLPAGGNRLYRVLPAD